MNNTETVYQAIKQINAEGKLAEMPEVARQANLSQDDTLIALQHLEAAGHISHDPLPSTGKDDYGKTLEFSSIRAI